MSGLEPLALLSAEPELGVVLTPGLRRLYGGDLALPERCLYANFVQTIDGVVAIPSFPGSNRIVSGGSDADRFVMGLLRAAADVVLIGSGTLRASARGRWRPDGVFPDAAEAYAELRHELGLEPQARVAILTASGSIPSDRAVLQDGPLVLTTNTGAERMAGTLPAEVDVVALPGDAEVDVRSAVELLRERGHRRILSEAGPHVFGSLVEVGLVDELYLTVSPLLAGRPPSGSFGLVEGAALLPGHAQPARLRSVRAHGSHLFLQYALS
jgi:riboflavin biosynthesis pyrimidine reductase